MKKDSKERQEKKNLLDKLFKLKENKILKLLEN